MADGGGKAGIFAFERWKMKPAVKDFSQAWSNERK